MLEALEQSTVDLAQDRKGPSPDGIWALEWLTEIENPPAPMRLPVAATQTSFFSH